jgi:DNA-binding LacI/PurR family transcriptional regulator
MGYTPNTLARALAKSSSNSVGIAISGDIQPLFQRHHPRRGKRMRQPAA